MARISDPIRLEVFKNALESVTESIAITMARTARSALVRGALDLSTGVLGPSGELVAQGLCQPMKLGMMPANLGACLDRYKGRVHPGDIFINNDPYHGGSHLPDVFIFKPVFHREVLLGYLCVECHHADMGGMVPGSVASSCTEIYQEGLRIPALKLYEEGVPNETLFRIIEKAVRVPDKVLGDLVGQVAAVGHGERQLQGLAQRYGIEEFLEAEQELLDYTERLTRQEIRTLPDGQWSFTDYVDDDGYESGPIPVVATVTKKGDQLHIDFTGTGPQCKGAVQPSFYVTESIAYAVVKTVLGADIPNTGGYFRPVKVTAPEGSFVNPMPPAPVSSMGVGLLRSAQVVFGAFAEMVPDRVPACFGGGQFVGTSGGYDKSKTPWRAWVMIDSVNDVATGGQPTKDGMDAYPSPINIPCNTPSEITEMDYPMLMEEYSLVTDTEGAGKFRGGVGIARQYRISRDDTFFQVRTDRAKFPPYGLSGGLPGSFTQVSMNPGRSDGRVMPSKFVTTLKKGEVIRVESSGAGGWGNPLERDPERVLQDVIAEKVSVQRARDIYGVVVDLEGRTIDEAATRLLRQELRSRDG